EAMPLNKDIDVTLEYGDTAPYSADLQGKQGLFRRFRQLTPEFKEEQCNNGESMEMLPEGYLKASQCANFIQENPAGIATYLQNFDEAIKGLPEVMKQHKYSSEGFKNRVLRQVGE
ncbi:MAG: glycosyl hydrolase family 31, partial [Muribaculaceae bacterium]|nr:glycosyl hydrolase family 31 [Muribaculaceae bacterium]